MEKVYFVTTISVLVHEHNEAFQTFSEQLYHPHYRYGPGMSKRLNNWQFYYVIVAQMVQYKILDKVAYSCSTKW